MKRWHYYALMVGILVAFGLWFAKVFPDPYHKNGKVNIYQWIWRELDELLHGEK